MLALTPANTTRTAGQPTMTGVNRASVGWETVNCLTHSLRANVSLTRGVSPSQQIIAPSVIPVSPDLRVTVDILQPGAEVQLYIEEKPGLGLLRHQN